MRVILLAAGFSRRMGQPKQARLLDGVPMARRAAELFLAAAHEVIVVIGAHGAQVKAALHGLPCVFVVNPRPEDGMFSSVQIGCAAVPAGEAALLCPCDCPGVQPQTIRLIAARLTAEPRKIVIPQYLGRRGHPVGLPAWLIAYVAQLPPDTPGLRSLWQAFADRITLVDTQDDAILHDLDTPEDARRFCLASK